MKKIVKYLSPWWICGFVGIFSPFVYAWLPVNGATMCLCSFYEDKLNSNWRKYPFLTNDDFIFLEYVNVVSYYLINYLFMIGLVFMVKKIRHINDDTKIKMEC